MKQFIRTLIRENMENQILYSAVVLNEKSKGFLFQTFGDLIPDDWKKIGHHMTIVFGKGLDDKTEVGKVVKLTVTKVGVSNMAIAVGVEGYPSNNPKPHITLAINPDGGKPVMSNDIEAWKPVTPFELYGVVTEIKKN